MLTTATRLKNIAFLVLGSVVLAFLGARYADLGHYFGMRNYYVVRAQLPETGGLFTHSNVTYRGVSVGRVGPIDLTAGGVEAELRIDDSAPPIPDDLEAVVAQLSAVGEQYIDLRPTRDTGPYLEDGSVLPTESVRTPAPVTEVLTSVNSLVSSVPLESLRTVVDEFGRAFQGHGDDLAALLDNGGAFIEAADEALPETTRLVTDAETVLRTQAEKGEELRTFARGAEELAGRLKESDGDLRKVIAAGPGATREVRALLRDLDPGMSVLIANLLTTSEIAVTRQRGFEELLVKAPAVVAAGATAVNSEGANFGMAVTFFEPLPCTAGYEGTDYRNGLDTGPGPALNTSARCTAPPGSGVNVRGSANAPRGGVPEPARPASLGLGPVPESGGGLPGALGLSALPAGGPSDLGGLLGLRDGP